MAEVEFEPVSQPSYKITITLDEEELRALEGFLRKAAPPEEYNQGNIGLDIAQEIYYAIP